MLSPSARKQYRMARLVMRTHAVPTPASANGSASSARVISTMPVHATRGFFLRSNIDRSAGVFIASRAIGHAFAEQPRRAEDEHADQHQEREHVLVVGTEQREIGIAGAAQPQRIEPRRELAQVGEVADIALS